MNFHQSPNQTQSQRSKSKQMIVNNVNNVNKKKVKNLPPPTSMKTLKINVRELMINKYLTDVDSYSKKTVTDIIYNEKSHIVAKFKDFLIYDDLSEFLKRCYKFEESYLRLPKIIEYYDNYSKIFPNYIMLSEAKYIYKNIQKKQKMIDNQHKYENDREKSKKKILEDDNVFNTDIYDSIMNQTETQLKDQSLNEPWNVAFNHEIGEKVNIFQLENSFMSIERLIDNIAEAEKLTPEPILKSKINLLHKGEGNETSPFASPPISHRDRPNKLLSPVFTKKNSNENYNIGKNINFISNNKNFPSGTPSTITADTGSITNKKLTDSLLNKLITKNEDFKFESNLLQKKYKEIKNKNRLSTDLSNLTSFKDKMKMESTIYSANPGSSPMKLERTKSSGKDQNKPVTNYDERMPSSTRPKLDSDTINTNLSNKNSLTNLASGSKMTNNIFYIINQNPQISAQITIVNNNVNQETYKDKLNLKTTRESGNNPIQMNSLNTKMIFKASEKNNFKKLHTLKPEVYAHKNKNPMNTLKGISNHQNSNLNYIIPNSKTIVTGNSTSRFSNNCNSGKLPFYVKNDNRDSTPSLTSRQGARSDTVLKNNLATINYDENNTKNNLYDKYLHRGNLNSDKKSLATSQKIRRMSIGSEPRNETDRVKQNNYVSPIHKKKSTLEDQKVSLSPGLKLACQNSLRGSYTHRKTLSNVVDLKSTTNTSAAFKSGFKTGYEQVLTVKVAPTSTTNNIKLSQTKGIPIKNFKELIKQNTFLPTPNSDRNISIKVDRLNKIK